MAAVTDFLRNSLLLDTGTLAGLSSFCVQRVPHGPGAKIKNEAIVTFESVEARDVVRGAARNLAWKGQEYRVRLEIPNQMKTAMKALQSVAYEIRRKYPTARTNVLMDDDNLDLILDFGTSEGQSWRRMTSLQARDRSKKGSSGGRRNLEEGELDCLLGEQHLGSP